jgi:hypothetical protein
MPTNWNEQVSAFFGELVHHDYNPSADEELVKRLVKQFIDEQEAG